ncbi:MAG: adenylate/guanylate cyclase domain-containing protein [Desulfobacterales bacterium]|nr:adenylate/guanylate cyclase domain-containing protein [Desulfobacterales bacterium]
MQTDERVERQLPARIVSAIRRHQDNSERLVGWIQLTVVLFFGLLYGVSPKTFSTSRTFALVPWFLAGYTVLTSIRLWLSIRGRLSSPWLYLSVVVDMALLMAMIWAFHLQYMQPPSFYLKSPTLLYVFIFIALRTLRFEVRFVVTAGLVAAMGWAAMAVYATAASGGVAMITRNYVKYMTSNSILVGAELDKIITILTVTVILAVAISRARLLLVRALSEESAARDLARFFSPEVAGQIVASEEQIRAGQGKARDAAIVNCDLRGFTRLAAGMAPDDLICLLTDYQALMVPVIHRHGGTVDKFMGDGILATFGAAVANDTYAADALRAVDAMLAAVDGWNEERRRNGQPAVAIGAAVAAGPVVFGAVGDATRLEYTVIGDAVNLSAKLEKHNKAEGVRALAPARDFDLAMAQGYRPPHDCRPLGARRVDGVDAPLDLVVLAP